MAKEFLLQPLRWVWQYMHKSPAKLVEDGRGYKVYRALIAQADSDPPVVLEVLENSLNIDITWFAAGDGDFLGITNKTLFYSPISDITVTPSANFTSGTTTANVITVTPVFFNAFAISTYHDGVLANDILGTDTPSILEIRLYN